MLAKLLAYLKIHRKAVLGYLTFALGILGAAGQHYNWSLWWLPLVASAITAVGVHAVPNATPPAPAPVQAAR